MLVSLNLHSSENNFNYTQNKNTLIGSFEDSDVDGVSDANDKCPDTPILDIVEANGCSKNQTPKFFNTLSLTTGLVYTKKENKSRFKKQSYEEWFFPVSIFANKNNWIFTLTSGYIDSKLNKNSNNGISDTDVIVGYLFDYTKEGYGVFGLKSKVKFPTSDTSEYEDYTFQAETYQNFNLHSFFFDVGYSAIGSKRSYKNSYYFDGDYSYSIKKFDVGVHYFIERNLDESRTLQDISIYTFYKLNKNYSLYLGYTRDCFDARDYDSISFNITYNF